MFIASSSWKVSVYLCSNGRTHVEDLKNLVEIQPPSGDLLLVVLRVESWGDPTPFIPFDELSLDICNGPRVEIALEGGSESMSRRAWTRRTRSVPLRSSPDQALDRYPPKTTQAQHSPVRQPLSPMWVRIWSKSFQMSKKHTPVVARRVLTKPKTALAGVTVKISARLGVSIAAVEAEVASSRSFGC